MSHRDFTHRAFSVSVRECSLCLSESDDVLLDSLLNVFVQTNFLHFLLGEIALAQAISL